MANNTLVTRIALKSDLAGNWANSQLVLLNGEFAIESDTRKFKMGNGVDVYSALEYAKAEAIGHDLYMLIANYDSNADGSVDKADSLKHGDQFIVIDDTGDAGLWTAAKVKEEIQAVKDAYVPLTQKGVADGVATLDANGHVPASQLPSFVDDVVEFADKATMEASTGEAGKIYVTLNDGKTYRWSGSAFVVISDTLALGETQGTAYEGSKGAANAAAIAQLQTDLDALEGNVGQLGALAHKDTVAEADIDADAVTTAKIKDLNVTEGKLADGAVTTNKIASANVTEDKIASNAVVTAKVADKAITDAKIDTVSASKLVQAQDDVLVFDCGDSVA